MPRRGPAEDGLAAGPPSRAAVVVLLGEHVEQAPDRAAHPHLAALREALDAHGEVTGSEDGQVLARYGERGSSIRIR